MTSAPAGAATLDSLQSNQIINKGANPAGSLIAANSRIVLYRTDRGLYTNLLVPMLLVPIPGMYELHVYRAPTCKLPLIEYGRY